MFDCDPGPAGVGRHKTYVKPSSLRWRSGEGHSWVVLDGALSMNEDRRNC